jgi:hypothetical protein
MTTEVLRERLRHALLDANARAESAHRALIAGRLATAAKILDSLKLAFQRVAKFEKDLSFAGVDCSIDPELAEIAEILRLKNESLQQKLESTLESMQSEIVACGVAGSKIRKFRTHYRPFSVFSVEA